MPSFNIHLYLSDIKVEWFTVWTRTAKLHLMQCYFYNTINLACHIWQANQRHMIRAQQAGSPSNASNSLNEQLQCPQAHNAI